MGSDHWGESNNSELKCQPFTLSGVRQSMYVYVPTVI